MVIYIYIYSFRVRANKTYKWVNSELLKIDIANIIYLCLFPTINRTAENSINFAAQAISRDRTTGVIQANRNMHIRKQCTRKNLRYGMVQQEV